MAAAAAAGGVARSHEADAWVDLILRAEPSRADPIGKEESGKPGVAPKGAIPVFTVFLHIFCPPIHFESTKQSE